MIPVTCIQSIARWCACSALLVAATSANALTINLEFAPGTLFSPTYDATAKAAINAAAADISSVITTSLNAITSDTYTGTNSSTEATFDWSYNYTNPSTGASTTVENITTPSEVVTLLVGTRSLSEDTLGVGGPSGIGYTLNGTGFPGQWVGAVANAESASEEALTRGGGPRIGTVSGNSDLASVTATFSIDYGLAYGSLALDNDGSSDWHWDHTTPVVSKKNDLYSVALHEIVHALGIGTADTWDDWSSGTTWNGPEVQAITGTGTNLVSGGHIASGVMSRRVSDGASQEVLMDPSITTGTRKELTELDLAFLRDIGWETIYPTFPSSPADFDGDGDVDGDDLVRWENSFTYNAAGDADEDSDTDGSDFLIWQREYTGTVPISSGIAVPEPTSLALLLVGIICYARRSRS